MLGITLHPWQAWLLVHMLELLPSGDLRFRTVVVLVARQNGKTTLSTVLALFFMYVLGRKLVLGTAQDLDVAEEIWQSAVDMVTEVDDDEDPIRPDLFELYDHTVNVNGKKALVLTGGERYKVKAANRGAGRSLSGDLILLDELREHRTWDAWGAITKTTMARAFSLVLCLSNAGDVASVVLTHLRKMAHLALGDPDGVFDGDDVPATEPDDFELAYGDDLGLFEWSAPPGCALTDRKGWAWANPSLNHPNGITERAIASAVRTDPESVVRPEVLCQWVGDDKRRNISITRWQHLGNADAAPPEHVGGWAIDAAVVPTRQGDEVHAAISASGKVGDDRYLAFVAEADSGTSWVLPKLIELKRTKGLRRVSVSTTSPAAAALIPHIEKAGIQVVPMNAARQAEACAVLAELVKDGHIVHLGDPLVLDALLAAATAPIGDGGWRWHHQGSPADITTIVSLTMAVAAARLSVKAAWGSTAKPEGSEARKPAADANPFRSRDRLRI